MSRFETLKPIGRQELLSSLPPEWPDDTLPVEIRKRVKQSGRKIVVLDDDPTGTQTVHDLYVLTEWSVEQLKSALREAASCFYILTNSRSVSAEHAVQLNREIARNLTLASIETGVDFVVTSRSDSTLRGHYPAEIEALQSTIERETGIQFDGHILVPFFLEGGRLTADDVHWVQENEMLFPAAQTDYASDAVFGYRSSDLKKWIAEKHGGSFDPSDTLSISIPDLRSGGPERVEELLKRTSGGSPIIVNSVSYRDLEVFVAGLLRAEAAGKRILYRTAASFIPVRIGLNRRELIAADELYGSGSGRNGGLVIVGSYVQKSTQQLQALMEIRDLGAVELDALEVLRGTGREAAINHAVASLTATIAAGYDGVLSTSRDLLQSTTTEESLASGRAISAALVEIVKRLQIQPRFIVAKGGITSSNIATAALGVERAYVLGQIAPGVPVWRLGAESRFPGVPYVVFPGNVGSRSMLAEVVEVLRK